MKDPKEREKYDKQGKQYKPKEALFNEEFHPNAYGGDSDESRGGIKEHAEYDGYYDGAKPYKAILKIYSDATPHIQSIFRKDSLDPKGSLDPRIQKHLYQYNKKIKQHNREKGLPNDKFRINYEVFANNMKMVAGYLRELKANPNDENAIKWVASFHTQLAKYIEDNHYPKSWLVTLGKQTTDAPQASTGRAPAGGGGGPSNLNLTRDSGLFNFDDIDMKDAQPLPSPFAEDASMRTAPDSIPEYLNRAGYTPDGKRILGFSPVYRTDRRTRQQYFSHAYFVVEQLTEPNPIKLLSSANLGYQATDNYLDLPNDERIDIRDNSVRKYLPQAREFMGILGFASNPIDNHDEDAGVQYPRGYVLARFGDEDDEYKIIMSRVMLREVLGQRAADKIIAKFFANLGEVAPWEVPPKRISEGKRSDIKWGQQLRSG